VDEQGGTFCQRHADCDGKQSLQPVADRTGANIAWPWSRTRWFQDCFHALMHKWLGYSTFLQNSKAYESSN
jgi:hypothetical protein